MTESEHIEAQSSIPEKKGIETSKIVAALLAIAVVCIALTVFINFKIEQNRIDEAAAEKQSDVNVAAAEANRALDSLYAYRDALTAGGAPEEIQKQAYAAQSSATTFAQSEMGKLLPEFSAALVQAADKYVQAEQAWQKASDEINKVYWADAKIAHAAGRPLPDWANYPVDETESDRLVAEADASLERARLNLISATELSSGQ